MNTIRQSFFNQLTTSRTYFARVARIHENHGSTGTFRLVGCELCELIPGYVRNGFVKFVTEDLSLVAHHVFNVELFKGYYLIFVHQPTRKLMSKIISFIGNSFVNARNPFVLLFLSGVPLSALLNLL